MSSYSSPPQRSDSPPPPMPSPQLLPTPLSCPPSFSRSRPSPRRSNAPRTKPPALVLDERSLYQSRSYDGLRERRDLRSWQPSKRNSPPNTPHSPSLPSPSSLRPSPSFQSLKRRTISVAIPYLSPPPSPTLALPPPPVPPIPAFALSPSDKKPRLQPQRSRDRPYLNSARDLEMSPTPTLVALPPTSPLASSRKECGSITTTSGSKGKALPTPPLPVPTPARTEKVMTCLRFFSLRNSNPKIHPTDV